MSEMGLLEKRLKGLYEKKKKIYPIKHSWNPDRENDYAVFCARDFLDIVKEMMEDFPILEAGSFSKLPDGTIIDYWTKEVLDWKKRWLTPKEKCKHENLRTPKVDGKYLWEFKECPKCGEVFHT